MHNMRTITMMLNAFIEMPQDIRTDDKIPSKNGVKVEERDADEAVEDDATPPLSFAKSEEFADALQNVCDNAAADPVGERRPGLKHSHHSEEMDAQTSEAISYFDDKSLAEMHASLCGYQVANYDRLMTLHRIYKNAQATQKLLDMEHELQELVRISQELVSAKGLFSYSQLPVATGSAEESSEEVAKELARR